MARKRTANGNGLHEPMKISDGRNSIDPEMLRQSFDRLDELHDQIESFAAGKRGDIKEVYDGLASKTGVPRKIVGMEYRLHRARLKREKREAELTADEKDKLDLLRVALGDDYVGTPLGKAAMEQAGADA